MREVVITGMGMITPIGSNKENIIHAMKNQISGIKEIKNYDNSEMQVKFAAEVHDFEPEKYISKKSAKRMDRVSQMAVAAAKEALIDSNLSQDIFHNNLRIGINLATGIGGLQTIETEYNRALDRGFDKVSPFFIPMAIVNMSAAFIGIELGIHGSTQCVVTACASSNNAIGEAFRKIKDGYIDIMFAGGAEASITKFGMGGFTAMTATTTCTELERTSIPFDKERSGFVMGEGAGILVLEEKEHAIKRGAKIYAQIVGYGESCDASHMSAPDPEGKYAELAMQAALKEAGIGAEQIDYINAHGTSTPLNDQVEAKVITRLFGSNCPVSSTKSQTGHLLGASGAVDSILTLLAMNQNFYPINCNYKIPDENININLITELTPANIQYALKSSLGFGGHNSILIYKRG